MNSITFGGPDSWEHFVNSHPFFFERFPHLKTAEEVAFIREAALSTRVDKVVFFIGRLCVEDFNEILLLCGNGYGVGALKILRRMYERVVTAWYLHQHPEEAEAFLNFRWVSIHKLANNIKSLFGKDVFKKRGIPQETIGEHEAKFHEDRKQFMVTICKKCNTQRENFTWSLLSIPVMAKKAMPKKARLKKARGVEQLLIDGYFMPTLQAHSIVEAMIERLSETESGGRLTFNEGPQYDRAEQALFTAHALMLYILDLQMEHFNLESLESPLQNCLQDFQEIWGNSLHR
jgi:hypothetical protein